RPSQRPAGLLPGGGPLHPGHPHRYEFLATRAAFTGVLGHGMPVAPVAGVRGADLAADDPLRREWDLVVIAPRCARDRLTVGQLLTLPGATPVKPRPTLYKVKRGDTLSSIAERKLGDAARWRDIFTLNRDILADPDEISPGQVLV